MVRLRKGLDSLEDWCLASCSAQVCWSLCLFDRWKSLERNGRTPWHGVWVYAGSEWRLDSANIHTRVHIHDFPNEQTNN